MKKILHVFKTYYPASQGGVEAVIKNICVSVLAEHRVLTVSPAGVGVNVYDYAGVRVYGMSMFADVASTPLPSPSFSNMSLMKEQFDWCDVVHMHYPWPFSDLACLLFAKNKKIVVTYHSDVVKQSFLDRLYSPLRSCFLRRVDAIVATSPDYAASSHILNCYKEKLHVVPLSLERNFGDEISLDLISDEARASAKGDFFFFVGVHRYYKGLEYFIRAASLVPHKIVIAGSGPETTSLKCLADELKLNNVIFAGRINDDEKKFFLSKCLAFVLPSHLRSEAFGVCLLEAMAFAKPLITCDIGSGMNFVNLDKVTGLSVCPRSPEALAEAMNFIAINRDRTEAMGLAALSRFQSEFVNDVTAGGYANLYFS